MHPGRNAPNALEDAVSHIRRGMGSARRGRESLPELRAKERVLLRDWAQAESCIFNEDPTLTLQRRRAHGEHVVAFDPVTKIWWTIDGILAEISGDAEHDGLLEQVIS